MRKVTEEEIHNFAEKIVNKKVYGIPKSGQILAYYVKSKYSNFTIVNDPSEADVLIDDVIDSGKTAERYGKQYSKPVVALVDKGKYLGGHPEWVVMPWEGEKLESDPLDIPIRLLQYIGEDVNRGGLQETPKRFLKAWNHYSKGYKESPEQIMKVFEDGG